MARLATTLREMGHAVITTREPTPGPVGQLIRAALGTTGPASALGDGVLPYLFAADRRDHIDRLVMPALREGKFVITDRFVPSSLAYQGVTIGVEAAFQLNAVFPAPDLTVVLDVPVRECLRRIAARGAARERFEEQRRLEAIAQAYDEGIAILERRGDRILRIDGTLTPDAVATTIWRALFDEDDLSAR